MPQSTKFAGAGSGWTNSSYITAFDSLYATATCSRIFVDGYEITPTPHLVASSFAHSIPAGDTVSGIEVEIRPTYIGGALGTLTGTAWLAIGGVQVGSTKTFSVTGVETAVILGSGSDLWGGAWNGTQLASLQVVIFVRPTTGSGTTTVYCNGIRTVANYTGSTPNAFTFTDIVNATLSTTYISNSITISGITSTVPVSFSGTGFYEKNNSGIWTASAGSAANGDTFRVRQVSSASTSTATSVTLTVGGVSDTYTVTTQATDTTPTAFSFLTAYNAEPSTVTSSNQITIAGTNSPAAITVSGASGQYSKNGAAYTSAAGTINTGDTVRVRGTSSASYGGTVTVTLTIGGVGGTFDIVTRAVDTTPNAFAFVDVPNSATSTLNTSNLLTITGIEAAANVTFAFAGNGSVQEYSIAGGVWTAIGATTITNGQTLQVRFISSANPTETGSLTVTVGGVSDTYSVSTTVDTIPTQFTFVDKTNAVAGVVYTSAAIVIAGMTAGIPVTGTSNGGEFNVNGGGFGTSAAVQNGDSITVRGTAPTIPGSTQSVIFLLGGISDTYGITTRAAYAQDF